MTNSDRSNKGIHTEQPTDMILPTRTESECSNSCSVLVSVDNSGSQDTGRINDEPTTLPEIEISSTTGNEDELYKMKANVESNEFTPAKIEFKRIKKKTRTCLCMMSPKKTNKKKSSRKEVQRYPETAVLVESPKRLQDALNNTFLSRLKQSFDKMRRTNQYLDQPPTRTSRQHDPEKIDVYYFDHGNAAYFRTTDSPPPIMSEALAQQTTYYATRFWAEIFGSLHIGVTFFLTFFLQTYRFILYSIVRAVIVGFFQMTSDYLLKPILIVIFNGLIQPILILIYNIMSSVKDMLEPIADTITVFLNPIAMLLRSIRLMSFNRKTILCKNSPGVSQ